MLILNWRDSTHPEGGGAEQFIERLAGGLSKHGYDVTLRCAHHPGAEHTEKLGDVQLVRRGGRFTVYLRAWLHLLLSPRRYDLVVDVQNGAPFWSRLATRAPVILVVHHVHHEQWQVVFGPMVGRLGWWLESKVAPRVYARCRYATVSHTTQLELARLGVAPERVTLVYSGRDVEVDLPTDVALTPWPSVVVLGRLVPHKRVELAIEAVGKLRAEFEDVRLTVVGQGWWEPHLRELTERLGLSERVDFTGFVDGVAKNRLLAESWVHVLPSLKEGWGLTVIEAGSVRTPTIAFRSAGGTTESVVDGVTGVLVDREDALTAEIAALLRDHLRRHRMGAAAQEYAQHFSWDKTVARFIELADITVARQPLWRLAPIAPPSYAPVYATTEPTAQLPVEIPSQRSGAGGKRTSRRPEVVRIDDGDVPTAAAGE